jgi:putative transposase
MSNVLLLLFHLLTILARLIRPGGYRSVIAENLLLKQQLIIHSRSRQRSPNLSTQQRALLGFLSLFLSPRRISRTAIIIRPSTLLRFHRALVKRKYQQLYSPDGGRKPGPSGPSNAIIRAIVEIKRRNPRYGCPRIANKSTWLLGWTWTKTLFDVSWLPITNQIPVRAAPPGYHSLATPRIVSGASICSAANRHAGSSRIWC